MAQSDRTLTAVLGRPGPRAKRGGTSILGEPWVALAAVVIAIFLSIFVILPLLIVFKASFFHDGILSLEHYRKLFEDSQYLRPLWNSLSLGAAVAVAGTFLGYVFAYCLTLTAMPGKRFFRFTATFPMISPPFMIAIAVIMLLGRNGVITRELIDLGNIYGFWGLFLVETLSYFPTAFLVLIAVFQSIDPVLEEAAQNQGATPLRAFRDVIVPLSMPGVLSSLLLIFIESLADFGNPLILSGDFKVLCVEAYLKITGEYDTAAGAVLSILLLLPSLIAFFIQKFYVDRKSFATLTGKPSSSRRKADSKWGPWAAFAACLVIALPIALFYGAVIYGSFVKTWGADASFTLDHYTETLRGSWGTLSDSLLLAAISTPITGILGMIIAYLLVRKSFPGRSLMEVVSMLTFAVPGTVVGIGYILAFNDPPIQLTGTAAIVIILFIFRNAPVGIRAGMTAIRQIDRSIEEGSANLGAGSMTTFRRIVLPLIAPAFFSGLAYSFVRCMTAISAVIFVVSGRWNLVTVSILGYVENSALSRASAMCMVLVIIVAFVLGALNLWVGRTRQGETWV